MTLLEHRSATGHLAADGRAGAGRPPGDPDLVVCEPEQITPEWLSRVLGTEVTAVSTRPVGTGQIGSGVLARLEGPDVPPTLFVKLPTADPGMRPFLDGPYRAEVAFYAELAPTVAVRTPGCHLAAAAGPGEFTLVLDDVTPLVQADQMRGLTPGQAMDCAVNLAGLHGPRWCDPTLERIDGIQRPSVEENEQLAEMAGPTVEAFLAEMGDHLSDAERAVCEELPSLVGRWANGRSERFAPIHQDFRADNMLVDEAGVLPSLAVDFQTLTIGLPGRDLGFMLASSLDVDARRAFERGIVAAYHHGLRAHGVTGYGLDTCWDDYLFGLLQGPVIGTFGWLYGSRTPRGDEMFATIMRRCCRAIADHDALDLVRAA